MTTKRIVVTRPNHDLTTRYLSYYAGKFSNEVQQKGHSVTDLKNKRACKKYFESIVRKVKPDLIFLNGHGSSNQVCGQDNVAIVRSDDNAKILQDTVTYALSCQAANELGPESVHQGAKAFVGYNTDFIFYTDRDKQTKPHHDEVAKKFLEPATQVPISLLKGNTVTAACNNSRQAFRKNIRKLITSETSKADTALLSTLYWDMTHLVFSGDAKVKI
jgi:hypothetical protein